jgi:HPt (histidine-containing phosphotransfer) domain-containing protein
MMGDEREYLDAGMTDYISKPIRTDVLFVKLAQIARKAAHRPDSPAEKLNDAMDTADHAELPLLDLEKLTSLTTTLPVSDVRDLLRLFMLDTDKHIACIREQSADGNLSGIGHNAHDIVSTAGNMGASQLYALARELDAACRAGDDTSIKHLVSELAAANVRTADAIRGWIDESSVRQTA